MPDAQEVSVPDNEPFALVLKNAKRRIKDELAARETISASALDRIFARISAAYDRDNAQANDLNDLYRRGLDIARDRVRAGDKENEHFRDLVKRMIPFVEKCHSDALDLSKTIKGICALKGVDTSEIDRINSEHDALIAEARAAIGEGQP